MFSHGIQCNSSDQRLLKHDYRHIWEGERMDGLVLQEVFMHYSDSCIQRLEGSAGSNVFSDRRKEFWIVVGLNLCAEFAQLSGS